MVCTCWHTCKKRVSRPPNQAFALAYLGISLVHICSRQSLVHIIWLGQEDEHQQWFRQELSNWLALVFAWWVSIEIMLISIYFLPCICKRFDLGLARGSLRVSQGVRSQTTCDVQASWSKLFLQAKQVKLEVKISCRMLSPFLCRNTHTHTRTFSHTLTHLTLTLTLWVSHSLISLTLSLSDSLTQSIMNQWFDNLIIDAFIHLSTMQPTKPKNPVIMQTWARYSHRSTYSSMHAHVRALIYSIMRFNIHSCMHSCKERSPQSSSITIYNDLQRSTVWMCMMFVLICTELFDLVRLCSLGSAICAL